MQKLLPPSSSQSSAATFADSVQQKMQSWVQDVELVDRRMLDLCAEPADNEILLKALRYHLACGGGRSRSKLVLTTSSALGLTRDDAVSMAAAAELLHNASLVQDDLQDLARSRRGQPAVWNAFGTNTALGLTDLMITASFAAVADVTETKAIPRLIRRLHRAVAQTLYGQSYDVGQYGYDQLAPEICLEVARAKSGPLFALGLELPLITAELDDYVPYARGAANAFGMGYQIVDDITDRDEDKEQGAIANMVLALELENNPVEAQALAAKIAQEYLGLASIMGKQLPNQCGYLLEDFSDRLADKLGKSINA